MRDGPACRRRRSVLRRILEQHGIGVVDVEENLALDGEIAKSGDRAVLARDAHMPHALSCLVADAALYHLVIAPQRAVEKDERRPAQALLQRGRHRGTAGNEEKTRAGRVLDDLQADGTAILMNAGLPPRLLEPERDLSRHREGGHRERRSASA